MGCFKRPKAWHGNAITWQLISRIFTNQYTFCDAHNRVVQANHKYIAWYRSKGKIDLDWKKISPATLQQIDPIPSLTLSN